MGCGAHRHATHAWRDSPGAAVEVVQDAQGIRYATMAAEGTEYEHGRFDTLVLRSRPVAEADTPAHLGFGSDASVVGAEAPSPSPSAALKGDAELAAAGTEYAGFGAVYRIHSKDDLAYDAPELEAGLNQVLTDPETFFNQKRICTRGTPAGHVTLCSDRIKWTERGRVVREQALPSEAEWRSALRTDFNMVL